MQADIYMPLQLVRAKYWPTSFTIYKHPWHSILLPLMMLFMSAKSSILHVSVTHLIRPTNWQIDIPICTSILLVLVMHPKADCRHKKWFKPIYHMPIIVKNTASLITQLRIVSNFTFSPFQMRVQPYLDTLCKNKIYGTCLKSVNDDDMRTSLHALAS